MSIIFSQGSGVADSVFGKSQAPIKAMIESGVEAFQQFSAVDKVFSMDTTKTTPRSTPARRAWATSPMWARTAPTLRSACGGATPR